MASRWIACLLWTLGPALLIGCASARHVEMHPDGGVVAIPSNTNSWPFYHRDKALALIERGAPDGYEILHEEEAVARTVTHTTTRRKTQPAPMLVVGGAEASDDYPGPGGYPARPAAVALPLGEPREDSTQVTREQDVKEWRIYYRLKQKG